MNIADAVAENGGQPIRVATVKRGDQWYVSLFYTIADNAVHQAGLPNPTVADRIPDDGQGHAGTGRPGVRRRGIRRAASRDVIAVLPPDEMGVLHDYGKLLIDQAGAGDLTSGMADLGVTISNADLGRQRRHRRQEGVDRVADHHGRRPDRRPSPAIRPPDRSPLTCPARTPIVLDENTIDSFLTDAVGSDQLTPELLEIIKREFKQIIGLGIVTVQVDGKWYVSPIRSVSDIVVSLLKGLEPGDIDYLISLAQN